MTVPLERRRLRGASLVGELTFVAGCAAAVVALVCGGELAVLVMHRRAVAVPSSGGLGGVVRSLLGQGEPMADWPAWARVSATGYWVCVAVSATLLCGAGFLAWRWMAGRWQPRRSFIGLATRAQEWPLTARGVRRREARVHTRPSVTSSRRCGMPTIAYRLGRSARSRRQLYGTFEDHLGLVGLPGAGKSRRFIAPLVAQAPGAAVVTGVQKADVLALTGCLPDRAEPVLVLDPEGVSGWPDPMRFPLLAGCERPDVAWRRGYHFAAGARPERGPNSASNHEFFVHEAGSVIGALFCAAAIGAGGELDRVWRWGIRWGDEEPVRILRAHGAEYEAVAAGLATTYATEGPQRSGTLSQVRQSLACLASPNVREACSGRVGETLDAEEWILGRGRLYVLGRTDTQASISPVVNVLLDEVIAAALRLASRSPRNRLDPPLLLALDEVHNIARLPRLPEYISTGRGSGLWIVWGAQSRAAMREIWGQQGEGTIWQGTPAVAWFGSSKESDELQDLERLGGEVEETYWVRRPMGRDAYPRQQERRLVRATPVDYLRELPEGRVVLYHRGVPPVELVAPDWSQRRELAGAMRQSLSGFRARTGLDLR